MDLPDASRRVVEAARERGLDIEVHLFPDGTKTSADAATAAGCELSAIAKSLVFMVDDRPVVVIMSGDNRVDPGRLASAMGGENGRRAGLDEAREATGFAAGGTPAFGYTNPVDVVIDISLQRTCPDTVTVAVTDNGVGIPKEDLGKVFEPFHRLEPNHAHPGEGLGLTSARRILERHDGKIWVESEPGQGSHFYVSLPPVAT